MSLLTLQKMEKNKLNIERKQYTHGNELTRPEKHVPFMHCGFSFHCLKIIQDDSTRLGAIQNH